MCKCKCVKNPKNQLDYEFNDLIINNMRIIIFSHLRCQMIECILISMK